MESEGPVIKTGPVHLHAIRSIDESFLASFQAGKINSNKRKPEWIVNINLRLAYCMCAEGIFSSYLCH